MSAYWAGLATGLLTAIITTDLTHRVFAWAATRIDRHITAALDNDDDDPLEHEHRQLINQIDDDAA